MTAQLPASATYDHAQLARDAIELVGSPVATTLHYTDVSQLPRASVTPIYDEAQIVKSMSELGPSSGTETNCVSKM